MTIEITHTLKGWSSADPDDPGEASHYVLEFTDQHRQGWTTIADENVPVRLLVTTLERAFRIAGHDRIDDDMKTDTKRMVGLFNVYAEPR